MPLYINLPRPKQLELAQVFWWLPSVLDGMRPAGVLGCSVSAFDHWLSPDEAERLLVDVPPDQQHERDERHRAFCAELIAITPVLGFRVNGRRRSKLKFREFADRTTLSRRLGQRQNGDFHFSVVVPAWEVALLSGYDDTTHAFSKGGHGFDEVANLAESNGLHVLKHAD